MTELYLSVAQKFMTEGKWSYAETALCRALGHANKEGVSRGNIFKALNACRRVK